MTTKPELIYVGDPMCSWCWGMAPTIERLAARTDVDTRVVVGGLRPGPGAQPLDDGLRNYLAAAWAKVGEVSGQPFDTAALDRQDWVYDTELPAIAVTTMRQLSSHQTIGFFTHLQRSFYADGVDITVAEEYPHLIEGFGVDEQEFLVELSSPQARTRAWQDFAEARELGVLGFPTLLLAIGEDVQVLSRGYAGADQLDDLLAYWVEGRQPDAANTGACSIDEGC